MPPGGINYLPTYEVESLLSGEPFNNASRETLGLCKKESNAPQTEAMGILSSHPKRDLGIKTSKRVNAADAKKEAPPPYEYSFCDLES